MRKIYTEDLIRFIYNETSTQENHLIHDALQADADLMDTYSDLCETISGLNEAEQDASTSSIAIVLDASARLSAKTLLAP
jgi:hypothetical protein